MGLYERNELALGSEGFITSRQDLLSHGSIVENLGFFFNKIYILHL